MIVVGAASPAPSPVPPAADPGEDVVGGRDPGEEGVVVGGRDLGEEGVVVGGRDVGEEGAGCAALTTVGA